MRLINIRHAIRFYKDLINNSDLPKGIKEGNGYSMVQYPANGEASDWMLGSLGIYSFSPELGTSDK